MTTPEMNANWKAIARQLATARALAEAVLDNDLARVAQVVPDAEAILVEQINVARAVIALLEAREGPASETLHTSGHLAMTGQRTLKQ
jgi:hypothetical protein